jgi:hypothetical protein
MVGRGPSRLVRACGEYSLNGNQLKIKLMKRILIDLTPILPGGENGGAKTMTIELIRELSKLHRECEFVLLTSDCSHDELATLDAPNVRRVITRSVAQKLSVVKTWGRRFTNLLPAAARIKIRYLYLRTVCKHQGRPLLASLDADLLFCPFTAPFFMIQLFQLYRWSMICSTVTTINFLAQKKSIIAIEI